MYDRRVNAQKQRSIEEALGTVSDDIRNYKIAFFSESSLLLKTIR